MDSAFLIGILGDSSMHWSFRTTAQVARKELSLNSSYFLHKNYTYVLHLR